MTQLFGIHNFLCDNQDLSTIQFDLPNQLKVHTSTNGTSIVGNNDSDTATFRIDASAETVQSQ